MNFLGRIVVFGFHLSFSVLLTLLIGCAIYKEESYFSPTPQQGSGVISVQSLREIASIRLKDNVELDLMILGDPGNASLRLWITLPGGESLQFADANIYINSVSGNKTLTTGTMTVIRGIYIGIDGRGREMYLHSTEELHGDTYEQRGAFFGKTAVPRRYETDVKFPAPLPMRFQLQLPSLKLSGREVTLPVVFFERKSGLVYQGSPNR